MDWKIIVPNFSGAFIVFLMWFITALLSGWIFDKNGDCSILFLVINVLILIILFGGATLKSSSELRQSKKYDDQKIIKLRQEKHLANLDSLLKSNYGPFERLMFKETFLEKWENLEKEVQSLSMIEAEKEELLSALHKGEYDNAEKTLISLTNREAHELSKTIYELGNIYFIQHKLDQALDCFQKASQFSPNETAYLTEIGNIYFITNDLKKAREFQLKALKTAKKQVGTDHPNIGLILNYIGMICSKNGQHNDAIEYYLSALSILEKHIKFDHPSIGSVYNNLGLEYEAIGDKEKAIHYTEKALKTYQGFSGKDDDSIVQGLKDRLKDLKGKKGSGLNS